MNGRRSLGRHPGALPLTEAEQAAAQKAEAADAHRWLLARLKQMNRRHYGLPDLPAGVTAASADAPDEVRSINPVIAEIIGMLADHDIELGPNESLAEAVARNAFTREGEMTSFGRLFFAVFGAPEDREAAANA
jgi:hypothetical protein